MIRISLRTRTSIVLSIIVCICSLPILINTYYSRNTLVNEFFEQNHKSVMDNLEFFAVEALETGIDNIFEERSRVYVNRPDISTIELRDAANQTVQLIPEIPNYDGHIISMTIRSRPSKQNASDIREVLKITNDNEEDNRLGTLTVVFDNFEKSQKVDQIAKDLILLTVLVICVGIIGYFLTEYYITRRIKKMRQGLKAIKAGALETELIEIINDEIGDLSLLINDTAQSLRKKREAEIKDADERVRVISNSLQLEIDKVSKMENLAYRLLIPLDKAFKQALSLDKETYTDMEINKLIGLLQETVSVADDIDGALKTDHITTENQIMPEKVCDLIFLIEKVLAMSAQDMDFQLSTLTSDSVKSSELFVNVNKLVILRVLIYTLKLVRSDCKSNRITSNINIGGNFDTNKRASFQIFFSFSNHCYNDNDIRKIFNTHSHNNNVDPIESKLSLWFKQYGINAAATLKTNGDLLISYDFQASVVSADKLYESGLEPQAKPMHRHTIYCFGTKNFVSSLSSNAKEYGINVVEIDDDNKNIEKINSMLFVDLDLENSFSNSFDDRQKRFSLFCIYGVISVEQFSENINSLDEICQDFGIDELICGIPKGNDLIKIINQHKTKQTVTNLIKKITFNNTNE